MGALTEVPACQRQRPGCHLTTLFGTVESIEVKAIPENTPKKRGWLPLLTILFLISYGLMTMLIVEQGQTIESQRALIRELFRDSTELSATKMKTQQEQRAQAAQNLAQNPSSQNPSTQAPSRQAPANQIPSAQEQQRHAQSQAKAKSQFQMPSKPSFDLVDSRRVLITI